MTASGQKLEHSVGLRACLEALRPTWQRQRREVEAFNRTSRHLRRGVGVACGWYGIGNTSLSNPSTMRIGLGRDGVVTLYSGAVDIGQGSNTVMTQISAEALGVPVAAIRLVSGDTDLTPDAGKTSASRQTFVSGAAARLAAESLRRQILRLANVEESARIVLGAGRVVVCEGGTEHAIDLARLPTVERARRCAARARGISILPPRLSTRTARACPTPPTASRRRPRWSRSISSSAPRAFCHIGAAADVGRAINPTQVEGQLHGGVAQGLGLALMEEFIPGRTHNLHDYLIPTCGDVPPIDTHLIEDPEPLGPFGAKGIGEPALVPTAPAILNAIWHATGVRLLRVPATPDRLRAALCARAAERERKAAE